MSHASALVNPVYEFSDDSLRTTQATEATECINARWGTQSGSMTVRDCLFDGATSGQREAIRFTVSTTGTEDIDVTLEDNDFKSNVLFIEDIVNLSSGITIGFVYGGNNSNKERCVEDLFNSENDEATLNFDIVDWYYNNPGLPVTPAGEFYSYEILGDSLETGRAVVASCDTADVSFYIGGAYPSGVDG